MLAEIGRDCAGALALLPEGRFPDGFDRIEGKQLSAAGGPGIASILERLAGSARATSDQEDFFRTQVLFWMLAAIDGHAKNFSVFIGPRGRFRLTPRYAPRECLSV